MEKDLKIDTELIKKLSESQTLICIADKEFILNEMSIGRAKQFAIQIVKSADSISKKAGKDITELQVQDVLTEYGDWAFSEITKLFNWIFSYRNSEYTKITKIWVENNISIRMLVEITKEIARQNQLSWLIPFFQGKLREALKTEIVMQ